VKGSCLSYWWVFVLWLVPFGAGAATVHTWVDEGGVTHFSDQPPESEAVEVTVLEISEDYPQPAATDDDYYSIVNQWQRAQEERMVREQLKLERAKLKAQQQRQAPDYVEVNYQPVPYVVAPPRYPGFYGRGYGFYGRPGRGVYRPHGQGFQDYPGIAPYRSAHRGRGPSGSHTRRSSRLSFSLGPGLANQ
jgi:hypothetical protein